MPDDEVETDSRAAERLTFFSDAVVAIAITLLAIDLPVPEGGTVSVFWRSVEHDDGHYAAFLISFVVIAAAWAYHHVLFAYGLDPAGDRALGRLRGLGLRRGSREAHRDTDFGWASLTATERRITALVRDGLTNREIGTRLFVSPRTVQTHVSHILQKTGLRSRVEIARAAPA